VATRSQTKAVTVVPQTIWRRPRTLWIAGVAVLVVAVVVTAVVLSSRPSGRTLPAPRARVYSESQACLLTGPQGLGDPQAAAVWAGMQDASAKTKTKVSYLQVTGPATVANAVPFATSLIQSKCDVVLGVGAPETGALAQSAGSFPSAHFVILGGTATAANVTVVTETDAASVQAAVSGIVQKATAH
jgi:basic membrane lipoprotein Med (substrate-binding protein (PBP1-ABC) superfamily)